MSGFIVRQCPGQIVLYGEKKTRNLPGIQRHPSAFNRKIFLEINAAWYCRKCIETKVHTYYIILPRLIQPWYASIKATSVWLIRSITSLLDEITEESPNRQMDVWYIGENHFFMMKTQGSWKWFPNSLSPNLYIWNNYTSWTSYWIWHNW